MSAQTDAQCVAQFDASVTRYNEAVTVQTKREVTNLHQLNSLLCQGRLDLLDMEFALVDDYEQCARNGGAFPDKTVQRMTTLPDNLAAKKTAWIDTCGPYIRDEKPDPARQPAAQMTPQMKTSAAFTADVQGNPGKRADQPTASASATRGKKIARLGSKS